MLQKHNFFGDFYFIFPLYVFFMIEISNDEVVSFYAVEWRKEVP